MPRKDLTEERTAQILDALERCVMRLGLDGTSLEEIAEEAGVKRSLLRHYVGNRQTLVQAMADRFAGRYRQQIQEMEEFLVGPNCVKMLLDLFFAPNADDGYHDVRVMEALIHAAKDDQDIRKLVAELVDETIGVVRIILKRAYPEQSAKTLWTVSYGVVGIYFNYESLAPLNLPARHRLSARAAAQALIHSLA